MGPECVYIADTQRDIAGEINLFSYKVCYQQPLTRLLAVDSLVLDGTIPRSGGAADERECEKCL